MGKSVPVIVKLGAVKATALGLGRLHGCVVLSNGGVRCWGKNYHWQLGDGSMEDSNVPVAVKNVIGAKLLSKGLAFHNCAVLGDATVQCWGSNKQGELGIGSTSEQSLPVTVTSSANVTAIAVGFNHTCAIIGQSSVMCWGANGSGQLGNGTTVASSAPVQVSGL
jgi:alpha-tubulin suppressor-like RCC1 family protein